MEAFVAGMALLVDPKILLVVVAAPRHHRRRAARDQRLDHDRASAPLHHHMGRAGDRVLGAIYCAANFGGSITAILVNSPGDPSASATAFDGYPMAVKGEAGRALGMSALASAIGGSSASSC